MKHPPQNGTPTLEEILPRPMLAKLSAMAANGDGPLPRLLNRVIELGLKQLAEESPHSHGREELDRLTPRQLRVLENLREGYAVGEIAATLEISETTVRTHISRIKERLDCHDLLNLRLPIRNSIVHAEGGEHI